MSNDIPAHSVAVHDLKEVFKVCKVKEKLKSLFKPAKTPRSSDKYVPVGLRSRI